VAPALVLYDHPASTNAIKVRILLAELGLVAEVIEVPPHGERSPEYLELHPFGLIPTLVDGDLVVTESNTALRSAGVHA
jgi:glutathione S-transferase